ncbi:MAG: hypothetical protein OXR62_12210 [Ahrensia sp.]|nr:hypothetical protein [Ahrensia sp.]
MNWRPDPKEAQELLHKRLSDEKRWGAQSSYDDSWDARAEMAATFMRQSRCVLDLGAGKMGLRRYLEPGCDYQPADLAPLVSNALRIDLNTDPVPTGRWDTVSMLGVMEYLFSPQEVLVKIRAATNHLVFSYGVMTHNVSSVKQWRRDHGFATNLNEEELRSMISSSSFRIEEEKIFAELWGLKVIIFDCKA